jgi:hypothetical protein
LALTVGAGWEHFGPDYSNYITKDVSGPQGAEALIYWTDLPSGLARPCRWLRNQDAGPSGESLAAVLAAAPGTDLISGPSEVRLGGYPAQHVVLTVREDLGCDPGYFFRYPNVIGGALWPETLAGDTIRMWTVEVESERLFLAAATRCACAGLEQEVNDIVQAIAFPPVRGAAP